MTHRDDSGNVRVDFVWGNFPMQPNDDRTDQYINFGGGTGDHGWSSTYTFTSDTLQSGAYNDNSSVQDLFDILPNTGTDHINVGNGYSNFPGYIPNYAGDEDSGLEAVVPNLLRLSINEADDAVSAVNLNLVVNYHNPTVFYLESTGTTVRAYVYDEDAAGGGGAQDYLVGLKPGDQVYVDNTEVTFNDGDQVTITKVNEDGENSWIEFEVAEAFDPALDTSADGTVWPGTNVYNKVMVMRYWNQPGDIVDENTNIRVRVLGD